MIRDYTCHIVQLYSSLNECIWSWLSFTQRKQAMIRNWTAKSPVKVQGTVIFHPSEIFSLSQTASCIGMLVNSRLLSTFVHVYMCVFYSIIYWVCMSSVQYRAENLGHYSVLSRVILNKHEQVCLMYSVPQTDKYSANISTLPRTLYNIWEISFYSYSTPLIPSSVECRVSVDLMDTWQTGQMLSGHQILSGISGVLYTYRFISATPSEEIAPLYIII